MEINLKALGREGTHTETKDFRKFTNYVKVCTNYSTEILGDVRQPACKARSKAQTINDLWSEVMLEKRSVVWIPELYRRYFDARRKFQMFSPA